MQNIQTCTHYNKQLVYVYIYVFIYLFVESHVYYKLLF